MKFEYLIWIIIFIVFVGFTIFKKMRTASKAGEKGNFKLRTDWKVRFNKFMPHVQQMAGEEDTLKDQGQRRKEISAERIESAVEKSPLPEKKPALLKTVAERTEPTVSGKAILPKDLDSGIQDLRKAVIWSEILAPPLALRY